MKKIAAATGALAIAVAGLVSAPVAALASTPADGGTVAPVATTSATVSVPTTSGSTVDINYGFGSSTVITSIIADGKTYDIDDSLANTTYADILRVDNAWVQGVKELIFLQNQSNDAPRNILANNPNGLTMQDVFDNPVISSGSDNVFANRGANAPEGGGTANNNNIERISIMNDTPVSSTLPEETGFIVIERGGNDAFKIAAVTAVDSTTGKPTAWGPMISASAGDWGPVVGDFTSSIFVQQPGATEYSYTNSTSYGVQSVSAILFTYAELGINADETVYGISLLPGDAEDPAQTNPNLDTPEAAGGGLDLIGGAFVSAAPFAEPVTSEGPVGEDQTGDLILKSGDTTPNGKINRDCTVLVKPDVEGATVSDDGLTVIVPGEGTYVLDRSKGATGQITFTPEPTFLGTATPVTYQGCTVGGETASSTYTPTVYKGPEADPSAVTVNQGETATLTPTVTPGTQPLTGVAFDNGLTEKVVPGEGTWKIELNAEGKVVATFVPESGFTGPVTQQKYTVTDERELTATSTLDVIISPVTGDESAVIKPNETATLKPITTPGSGSITSVAFDNGLTEKVVPGEGTWKIELVDGQPVATFTPETDYDGPVTEQPYTVTDANQLTATGKLNVTIIHTGLNLVKGYEIVKDTNGNGINDKGDIVRWTFEVTNTGNIVLNDVSIDDPTLTALGIKVTCDPTTLEPKASGECVSGEYTITAADVKAGSIKNVATATGVVPPNTPGDPEDPISPESAVKIPTAKTPAGSLPATGAGPIAAISLAAIALLGGGAILISVRRKRDI